MLLSKLMILDFTFEKIDQTGSNLGSLNVLEETNCEKNEQNESVLLDFDISSGLLLVYCF